MTLEELKDIKSIIDRDLSRGKREDIVSLIEYVNGRLNQDKDAILSENFSSFISRNIVNKELSRVDIDDIMRASADIMEIYPYDFRVKDFIETDIEKLKLVVNQNNLDIILRILKKYNLHENNEKKRKI